MAETVARTSSSALIYSTLCLKSADQKEVREKCQGKANSKLSIKPNFVLLMLFFVHGLTGDAHETWISSGNGQFWPEWLINSADTLSIFSLDYPAPLFRKWANGEMELFERARNTLEKFANEGLGERPLIFVAHSLGGILTKIVLDISSSTHDREWRKISSNARMVAFLATPHNGAALACAFYNLPRTSSHIKLVPPDIHINLGDAKSVE